MTKANQGLEFKGCERRAPEITQKMIDAGVTELMGYEPGGDSAAEIVTRIFREMLGAAPSGSPVPKSTRRRSASR